MPGRCVLESNDPFMEIIEGAVQDVVYAPLERLTDALPRLSLHTLDLLLRTSLFLAVIVVFVLTTFCGVKLP
jgi:hypothetical protein